jgi:hypothetical protein
VGDAPEGLRLGARLQSGRERAGLTVIQAAERLHVDPHVIEALEGERFEELGASVYVRGHLRHYAELVGEPVGELQELYAASAHAARQPDLTRVPKREDPAAASRVLLIPAVLVVAAVAVIGTAWWVAAPAGGAEERGEAHGGGGDACSGRSAEPGPAGGGAAAPSGRGGAALHRGGGTEALRGTRGPRSDSAWLGGGFRLGRIGIAGRDCARCRAARGGGAGASRGRGDCADGAPGRSAAAAGGRPQNAFRRGQLG